MLAGSRRLLLKLSFVTAMVALVLSLQPAPAAASCTFGGYLEPGCSRSCFEQVYCQAIACFNQSTGSGEECCFYNDWARFCGSDCPLFCAEP